MKVSQRWQNFILGWSIPWVKVIFYTKKACVIKNEMPRLDKPQQFKIFASTELKEGALFQ